MAQVEDESRIPELDGVRGLAILMVLIYHFVSVGRSLTETAFFRSDISNIATVGWTGVDLFFVLSGFLITSILLKTRSDQHYFRNFYARRILRIFPVYYLVVGLVYFFLLLFYRDGNSDAIQAGLPFSMFYLQNWLAIPKFAIHFSAMVPDWLGPTWSLAIEEQFYLLWPAVVYFFNRRNLFMISLAIVVFSFVVRALLVYTSSSWLSLEEFIYFSTVTRFDGLCMGSLVAIAFQSEKWKNYLARFAMPVFIGGLAGLVGVFLANDQIHVLAKNPYKDIFGFTLLALTSAALVVLVTTQSRQSALRFFFRNRIFAFWGKYSYAIYILHIPILLILRAQMKAWRFRGDLAWFVFMVLAFTLTILCALLTWHLLEKHALGLKKYFEYRGAENRE